MNFSFWKCVKKFSRIDKISGDKIVQNNTKITQNMLKTLQIEKLPWNFHEITKENWKLDQISIKLHKISQKFLKMR